MTWVFRTLIVPADQVDLARSLCAGLAGAGGDGMFTTPLSPDGTFPATHYISSGLIEDTFADLLPLRTVGETGEISTLPGHPDRVVYLSSDAGIEIDMSVINNLYASIDVSQDDPMQAISRMTIAMCQAEEFR